ncbi:methylmalonyl-CoA epimerase [Sanyastnella coralliicola]|uniref:methylmalonyl-CoA epimerase n=1 Tax=Sanyastnella coralliicola TaxID=3069118 RepID=UPI0027B8EC56|nr:methylmalonyl-CoA epimerase [Longitalea sp. SCSIO 12813]
MPNKIEHLGIAVSDLEASEKIFTDVLGAAPYKREEVESENVITSFFKVGENKIELLQATSEDSAIAKFIAAKGEGIHHVAFAVDDIQAEIDRLMNLGYRMIHEKPKEGADGKMIAFLHPKGSNRVLVELCADK